MSQSVKVLNKNFSVISYNGGSQDSMPEYDVSNVLTTSSRPVHCSGHGQNFDLVLKSDKPFTMTHFVTHGGSQCTAPLKSGLLWVSKDEPKIDYSSRFDNFTKEQFDKLERKGTPEEPILYFETEESLEFSGELDHWVEGQYVHIKFLSRHENGGKNIDIDYVALIGFEEVGMKENKIGEVPEELGVTNPKQKKWSKLHSTFMPSIRVKPALILFSEDEGLKASLKEIAESDKFNNIGFFWTVWSDQFGERIGQHIGAPSDTDALTILDLQSSHKYVLKGEINKENAIKFCEDYSAGKLSEYVKSASRPENDSDPNHPGLTIVVADSFAELVLNPEKDVLLDVYADWCGPCQAIAPIYFKLAEMLKDIPSIVIAKLDCDVNDTDSNYLPETSIPNIKLFPKGDKNKWIKFEGERSLSGLLKFLHENCSEKFDIDSMLKEASVQEEISRLKRVVATEFVSVMKDFEIFSSKLSSEESAGLKKELDSLENALDDHGTTKQKFEDLLKHFQDNSLVQKFKQIAKEEKQSIEKTSSKNVKKVHSNEEFDEIIANTKDKLIVVDFFATWCGPCKRIAPFIADLSEEYLDVVFLKVDVDDLEETSQKCSITAMPTFVYFKDGKEVDRLKGASSSDLKALVLKHK